jgi:hypothetical protein
MATLKKLSDGRPKDPDASLTLATWQAWFGKEADYEATRRRIVQWAAGTEDAATAQSAAKACCLRPVTDPDLLAKSVELARLGVKLRTGTPWLPWYQLSLGLAEYRSGEYASAEQTLAVAEQTAGKQRDIPGTARLFRAMSLFRQGRAQEAQAVFSEAEAKMPPFPQDEGKPVIGGKTASHDVMICWLAYREAKAVLNGMDSTP